MPEIFYADRGNDLLKALSDNLGLNHDTGKSARILSAVLITIRNQVPVLVSLNFMAMLPMSLKAVYLGGWKIPAKTSRSGKRLDSFIHAVMLEGNRKRNMLFRTKYDALRSAKAVLRTLENFYPGESLKKVHQYLPEELAAPSKEIV